MAPWGQECDLVSLSQSWADGTSTTHGRGAHTTDAQELGMPGVSHALGSQHVPTQGHSRHSL